MHPSCTISQEQCSIWSWFLIHLCKMMVSFFFHFFYIFIFWAVKEQKVKSSPKWKKNCLLHFLSQEPYIIWLSFMIHKCSMIISLGLFFSIFSKFLIFWVVERVKGQKMTQNDKTLSFALYISRTMHHMILMYCTHV